METITFFEQHWALILFVGGVIASWARYEMKIGILEKNVGISHKDNQNEIDKLKVAMMAQEKAMDTFKEGIGKNIQEIQTTMKFILAAIEKLQK